MDIARNVAEIDQLIAEHERRLLLVNACREYRQTEAVPIDSLEVIAHLLESIIAALKSERAAMLQDTHRQRNA